MPYCWSCNTAYTSMKRTPGFHDTCDKCQSYWHSCCNCRHFTGYPIGRCRVPNIEPVQDVEGANFCDEFALAAEPPGSAQADADRSDARRKWDQLFKD